MDIVNSSLQINAMTDIGRLVSNVVNQFVVRPTGQTISGFIFDIVDDEEISLDSDITDHYVEENYAIQDHIALRPERFQLKGFVGELNDIFPNSVLGVLTALQSVGIVDSFAPQFTQQATELYIKLNNQLAQAQRVVSEAQNIYNIFTNYATTSTKQQNAYYYFRNMWISRQLCDVETPFCIFKDMAIEKVTALQRGQSKMVSDFSVTFKHIRTVSSQVLKPNSSSQFSGDLQNLAGGVFDTQSTPVYSGRVSQLVSTTTFNGQTSGIGVNNIGQAVSVGDFSRYYTIAVAN